MKYTTVKVKKPSGGYRNQRAMVLASGKYKFVKNAHGGATHHPTKKHHKKGKKAVASKAMTKHRKRSTTHHKKSHRRRRHGGGGGMTGIVPVAIAAGGLAYLTSANGPQALRNLAAKIPGNKTFGATATIGIACLAADRFVKRNKWLRLAGMVGIVAAAMQIGTKGSKFQWVGDDDIGDIGDDDIGDELEDVGDDDIGDDDAGDLEGDDD